MREIKFQLYNDEDNRMEKVTGMEWNEGHSAWICSSDFEGESSEWNVPMIIRQYTGLKDCEGVEIYEGDVIEDDEHYYSVVSWDENDFMFVASDFGALCDYNGTKIKVIGNIHQNPELIK